jgi:parallel beta-helix repeat protein
MPFRLLRNRLLPRSSAAVARVRPAVESLESRDVPSGSPIIVYPGPGNPLQTAITGAAAGSTILIEPGAYKEAITVDKANLTLIGLPGAGGVVIENPKAGSNADGILVTPHGSGFVLSNVTVRDFDEDGVLLAGLSGFRLSGVTAINNHDYGLFPVLSTHGIIEFSSASGSHDTGIYVGQSNDVILRDNIAHDNVNGFEVENSTGVQVDGNLAYGNTVGIFVDLLPPVDGITVTTSSHNTVAGNLVLNNNRANDADRTDLAAAEASGVGILLVGGDHTTVRDNLVTGNNVGGIVLLSGLDLEALGALPSGSYSAAGIDPNPEHTLIADNIVLGNGLHPADPSLPHADLIASPDALMGKDNHWRGNIFQTSFPGELP